MARILLCLSEAENLASVREALADTKHEVVDLSCPNPSETSLEAVSALIMEQNADVVVMDYWTEDAASVKLMQTITDKADRPEFIFIESGSEEVEREQVLMALNEGARAFLPKPLKVSALSNYIERALSGPGRLRLKALEPHGPEAAINQLEEQLGDLRAKTGGYQKLISYLLSTPVGVQTRKVLVVSDSPYQLELLKKILDEHNFAVLTASNPADGLTVAMSERPRIIISDLELEGQTGLEFCHAVKFTNKLIPCYFVICTANQDKISKVMTPGNGVDDCLVKPSGQNDTVDFISRVSLGMLL